MNFLLADRLAEGGSHRAELRSGRPLLYQQYSARFEPLFYQHSVLARFESKPAHRWENSSYRLLFAHSPVFDITCIIYGHSERDFLWIRTPLDGDWLASPCIRFCMHKLMRCSFIFAEVRFLVQVYRPNRKKCTCFADLPSNMLWRNSSTHFSHGHDFNSMRKMEIYMGSRW